MTAINLLAAQSCHKPQCNTLAFLHENKLISLMLVISIILHSLLFMDFGDSSQHISEKATSHSLSISLSPITPELPPEIEEQKPQQKSRPKPAPNKATLVKQTERPAETLITQKPDKPIEYIPQQEPQAQRLRRLAQNQQKRPALDSTQLSKARDEYMKALAAHIDKHKFYPRSARLRHIEGQVRVSFDLLSNGQILNLHTFSGQPILQKATLDSIRSALPMPPRPESLLALNTMKIEYSMQFALK
ncbi:MAG: TonB family protein [Gammaproteobacteria bacterium]